MVRNLLAMWVLFIPLETSPRHTSTQKQSSRCESFTALANSQACVKANAVCEWPQGRKRKRTKREMEEERERARVRGGSATGPGAGISLGNGYGHVQGHGQGRGDGGGGVYPHDTGYMSRLDSHSHSHSHSLENTRPVRPFFDSACFSFNLGERADQSGISEWTPQSTSFGILGLATQLCPTRSTPAPHKHSSPFPISARIGNFTRRRIESPSFLLPTI